MFNRIIIFLLLFGTWLVLSGFFNTFFIGLGLFSCFFAIFLAVMIRDKSANPVGVLGLSFNLVSYTFWLLKEIVVSSVDVAMKMWQLEPDISPEMEWISTPLKSDAGITIFGNSITLTPGTVTVDALHDGRVQVHALTEEGMNSVRSGDMLGRVVEVMGGES